MNVSLIDKLNAKLEYLITEGKDALTATESEVAVSADFDLPSYSDLFLRIEKHHLQSGLSLNSLLRFCFEHDWMENLLSLFNLQFKLLNATNLRRDKRHSIG